MRSVSLVNRLEFEFPGTLFQNGLCFGDVDNDQVNELVACNTNGELAIYKGKNVKPWKKCTGLGFATYVGVDDVRNIGENSIIVINADGMCYTFEISNTQKLAEDKSSKHLQEKSKTKASFGSPSTPILPKFKQQLPSNCRTAIIFDIDKDGKKEVIMAYTDRTVRIFQWKDHDKIVSNATMTSRTDEHQSSKKQTYKLTKQPSKDDDKKPPGLVKQSSKDSKDLNISGTESDGADSSVISLNPFESIEEGKFVLLKKIDILAQIGSLAVCSIGDGCHHLLASQPGGGYIVLGSYGKTNSEDGSFQSKSKPADVSRTLTSYPVRYLLSGIRSRSGVSNTEIIGSVQRQGRLSGLLGFCTLDGVFGVMDFLSNGEAVHPKATEHKWFAMDKLDVTMDGNDEIVLCAWDGMTYVLNCYQDIMCYNFGENVCAFKAGMYSLQSKSNVPCLCYATFTNRIMLYYDIKLDSMEGKSLHNTIIERLNADPRYKRLLESLKDTDGNVDIEKLKAFISR